MNVSCDWCATGAGLFPQTERVMPAYKPQCKYALRLASLPSCHMNVRAPLQTERRSLDALGDPNCYNVF